MRLLCAALLLAQASPPQDLPGKIRQLVEQIDSDDIAVADQAAADLTKLGPAALEPLREEARRRAGDLKLRLEEVIRKIGRTQRLEKVTGKIPRVTLKAQDRPVKEILDDLARQTGVSIEGEKLPAEARASLDVRDEILWKAIDALCRANGRLMYVYASKKILVQPGPYRDLPRVFERGFFFFVDHLAWEMEAGQPESSLEIEAALILPPGADPLSVELQMEELEDDQGTRLLADPGAGVFFTSTRYEDEEASGLVTPLSANAERGPKEDSKSLAKFKGRVALKFAADTALRVVLKDPLHQPAAAEKAGKFGLRIKRWKKDGDKIRINLSATAFRKADDAEAPPWRIALRDRAGNVVYGQQSNQVFMSGATFVLNEPGGKESDVSLFDGEMVFTLPAGAEPASLELLEATEVEEVIVPFDFKGLPLR